MEAICWTDNMENQKKIVMCKMIGLHTSPQQQIHTEEIMATFQQHCRLPQEYGDIHIQVLAPLEII